MLLNVQELVNRQSPVQFKGALDAADIFKHAPEFAPVGPLEYDLTAHAVEETVAVTGSLSCKVRMQCSRCLDSVEETIRVPFEEHFRIAKDGDAEQDDEDDNDAIPVTGDRIELDPFLGEELLVQLPYAPVCKEDCKGLCPECGSNRNERSCSCNTEKLDPRLAALQDWFKPQQD